MTDSSWGADRSIHIRRYSVIGSGSAGSSHVAVIDVTLAVSVVIGGGGAGSNEEANFKKWSGCFWEKYLCDINYRNIVRYHIIYPKETSPKFCYNLRLWCEFSNSSGTTTSLQNYREPPYSNKKISPSRSFSEGQILGKKPQVSTEYRRKKTGLSKRKFDFISFEKVSPTQSL